MFSFSPVVGNPLHLHKTYTAEGGERKVKGGKKRGEEQRGRGGEERGGKWRWGRKGGEGKGGEGKGESEGKRGR